MCHLPFGVFLALTGVSRQRQSIHGFIFVHETGKLGILVYSCFDKPLQIGRRDHNPEIIVGKLPTRAECELLMPVAILDDSLALGNSSNTSGQERSFVLCSWSSTPLSLFGNSGSIGVIRQVTPYTC